MSALTHLDHRLDAAALTCRAVIETPRGRRGKLAYDPASGAFELKRMLPDGMSFPLDFGFVPGTRCQDGDALDILVLSDEASAPGPLLTARLIGVIERPRKSRTARRCATTASLLPLRFRLFAKVTAVEELDADFVKDLTAFWENYNAQRWVTFKVLAIKGARAAATMIADAH